MKLLAIPLGCQKALHSHSAKSPKYGDISRWLTTAKWLVITQQKTLGKSLVIAMPLMKLLAIPLGCQRTTTKWLVISCQKALHSRSAKSPKDGDLSRWLTATKWLVMLRCRKNFLLTYTPYAALQNFLVPANLKVTLH